MHFAGLEAVRADGHLRVRKGRQAAGCLTGIGVSSDAPW